MIRFSFLLIFSIFIIGSLSQPAPMKIYASASSHGIDYIQGGSFSFADNLLIGGPNPFHKSTEFWFRADKSEYNAVGGGISDEKEFKFFVNASSIVRNPRPFLSFDVARHSQRGDIIAGIAYGFKDATQFGTRIEVVDQNKNVIGIDTPDLFLYSLMIDSSKEDNFVIYAVGYTFAPTEFIDTPSIVIARLQFNPVNFDQIRYDPQHDLATIKDDCYDVWTETNRPSIYKYEDPSKKEYLAIGIIGRCNAIIRAELMSTSQDLSGIILNFVELPKLVNQFEIGAVAFDVKKPRMYFTQRHYSSIDVELRVVDMITLNIDPNTLSLAQNGETSPVMAVDQETSILYVALADSDSIIKVNYDGTFKKEGFASLPVEFNKISSAITYNNFLYFTTWEPKAIIGRISFSNFCTSLCPSNGFCNNGKCECIEGFEGEQCLPRHVHEIVEKVQYQTGLNAAFICLTIFIAFTGAAGWFLWHRGKKIYSNTFSEINH